MTVAADAADRGRDDRPAPGGRGVAVVLVATIAQIAFWYAATPGPVLLDGVPQGFGSAARAIGVSLLVLLALPLATAPLHGVGRRSMGLRWGTTGRTLPWVGLVLVVASPVLWWAAADPALAATYPWPGVAWLQGPAWRWPAWAAGYALYYLAFEAFYRGFLLAALRPLVGSGGALWGQAALATLIHVGKPLAETAAAFPASLVFGLLTLRSRSIVPALVLHLGIGLLTDAAVVWRAA